MRRVILSRGGKGGADQEHHKLLLGLIFSTQELVFKTWRYSLYHPKFFKTCMVLKVLLRV
jgi:hypothetical protein